MDKNAEEMYLQNLEEFILDEDKIVTYKWLSKTLNIHVNQSKQLLYTFCSNEDKQKLVSVTYLLAGRLQSSGGNHITVVGQDKYEEVKSLFESLTSEHVYSVQKTKQTPLPGILYTVNSQLVDEKEDSSRNLGAIRCKESVRRAAEELALLRISVIPAPPTTVVPKPAPLTKSPPKESEKLSPAKAKVDDKNGKQQKDKKVNVGLAAMFAAQTSKTSNKTTPAPTASTAKGNNKSKKGGGISNFFCKLSKEEIEKETSKKDKAILVEDAEEEELEQIENKTSKDSSKSSSPTLNKQEAKPSATIKKEEGKPSTSKTVKSGKQTKQKRSRPKEKKEDGKKRKRIVVNDSDSSDEDIFAAEGDASSREPSPEPILHAKALESDNEEDVVQPTPPPQSSNGRSRRRRKVTKDKTFMDDDGYVVTEKVTEYESYSESDTESTETKKLKELPAMAAKVKEPSSLTSKVKTDKSKASSKKASPVKNKSPLKNKQQSLMNFFKKKD